MSRGNFFGINIYKRQYLGVDIYILIAQRQFWGQYFQAFMTGGKFLGQYFQAFAKEGYYLESIFESFMTRCQYLGVNISKRLRREEASIWCQCFQAFMLTGTV